MPSEGACQCTQSAVRSQFRWLTTVQTVAQRFRGEVFQIYAFVAQSATALV